ncbi:MAG: biopolymer transporter ExbD [Candidatus Cloacimonadota bacterium]|nr:MAG: biopolymer transporter ExbD [Candidatus Cloacimonadota bacterium]
MKMERRYKRMTSISPISIADIVLLLLIFFLLTSTFVIQQGIRVKLPKAFSEESATPDRITITMTEEGQLFLEDGLVGLDKLEIVLKEMIEEIGNPLIVIRADRTIIIEKVIRVMDITREAGAEKLLIATEHIMR